MTTNRPPYEPASFWSEPPPGVLGPWDPLNPDASPAHQDQERALLSVIRQSRAFNPVTIFEAGCGEGRLTKFFRTYFPGSEYYAIDISERQLNLARRQNPDAKFSQADITQLGPRIHEAYEDPSFEGYDLVIASEVLMHIKPPEVLVALSNLISLTNAVHGLLITIDWVPITGELVSLKRKAKANPNPDLYGPNGIAYWNFHHLYQRLIPKAGGTLGSTTRTGRQVIHVIRP